ncbi:ABC transporter ATP-binding protein [Paenibacillus sp. Soil522]|uniref:ABC transporter ATP-binding protein n=1 Tax=Paenibacillus sp. Soil522 TaxID=1736388 RepID=UPI0006F7341B|nr:ABC transporter ATP-binding protein [Paenibacillus sp. Soil522]KRE40936.1 ABC transporter ATP-binding protein [Paenibacillus sp. Soil522]
MLSVRNVGKMIDGRNILDNINFDIKEGEIVGLLGRNGVGKTTLLNTLVGILDPDSGDVRFEGRDVAKDHNVRKLLYFVPDHTAMFNGYTAKEIIKLHQVLYTEFDNAKMTTFLKQFNLPFNRSLRSFSRGMKALFFILLSICSGARLIVLDEPTNGLDIVVKKQIMQILLEEVSERGLSLIISTHLLHELEKIADKILLMKGGRLEMTVSMEEVKRHYKKVQVAYKDGSLENVAECDYVELIGQVGRVMTLLIKEQPEETMKKIWLTNPILLEELPITLEDIFETVLGEDIYV